MKGSSRMASLIFVLVFTANCLTIVGSGMRDEESTFVPEAHVPPPVEQSTDSSNGTLAVVLAAFDRTQEFLRNGVELGTMGLSQAFDQLFNLLETLYPMMLASVPLLMIMVGIIILYCCGRKMASQVSNTYDRLRTLEASIQNLQEECEEKVTKIAALEAELKEAKDKQLCCEIGAKFTHKNTERLRTKIKELEDEKCRLFAAMKEMTGEVQRSQKQLDKAVDDEKRNKVADKEEKARLSKSITELTKEVKRLEKQLDKAALDNKADKEAQKMMEKELKKKEKTRAALEFQVKSLHQRIDMQQIQELKLGTTKRELGEIKGQQARPTKGVHTPFVVRTPAMALSRVHVRTHEKSIHNLQEECREKSAKIAALEADKKEAERKGEQAQSTAVELKDQVEQLHKQLDKAMAVVEQNCQNKWLKFRAAKKEFEEMKLGRAGLKQSFRESSRVPLSHHSGLEVTVV